MRHWMTWTMMAVGALAFTGCKGKTSSAATAENQSAAEAESTATTTSSDQVDSQNNPPATFHPTATTARPGSGATGKAGKVSTGFSKDGKYVVQVKVFQARSQAKALEAKLISSGFPAYVAEVESPTADLSGTYYRVRIGGFATRAAANDFGQNSLKPQGFDYWVDAKSNDKAGVEIPSAPSHAVAKPVSKVSTPIPPPKPVPSRTVSAQGAPPPPVPSKSSMRMPVEPAAPSRVKDSMPASSSKRPGLNAPAATASPAPAIKPAPAVTASPAPSPAPSKAMATPAAASDSIPSPFSKQDYYRPTDDSSSESTNPKDAPVNTRRTLPTW
jgi:hypothetical protein